VAAAKKKVNYGFPQSFRETMYLANPSRYKRVACSLNIWVTDRGWRGRGGGGHESWALNYSFSNLQLVRKTKGLKNAARNRTGPWSSSDNWRVLPLSYCM